MILSEELSKFKIGSKEYKFFEKVFEKLGSNFVRKSFEEQQREVRSNLNKATEKYFQAYLFSDVIFKSVEQSESVQETSHETNHESFNLNKLVSCIHSMYFNMVATSLPSEESQEIKPFGISKEKALHAYELQDSESKRCEFKELVENNIKEFCKAIIVCAGGSIPPGGKWQNEFDRTMKDLESIITFTLSKETREHTQKQLREMTNTYYEELCRGLLLFEKALSLHEQKLGFESDLAEFYLHRCHAVCLKIKYCEIKILQTTYNHETIPALKKISLQLDQSEEKLKEKKNEISVALESYKNLGDDYKRCVEEYACLTKRIKEQQWAIDELKNQNPQHG